MSTQMQRSRQERALAQREREIAKYSKGGDLPKNGKIRNLTSADDKASKASRDVTALKRKLGVVAQQDGEA